MRKIHRQIGLFFAPFIAMSAITGLLWAYAPYIYMKQPPKTGAPPAIEEKGEYQAIPEVIRAARTLVAEGKISTINLRADGSRLIYLVSIRTKNEKTDVRVDASSGEAEIVVPTAAQKFHQWVVILHELKFFGTNKELTIIPGAALIALLVTGFFLLRKPSNKI